MWPAELALVLSLTFVQRLATALVAGLLCILWIYNSQKLAPGMPRLVAALPILAINFLLPLLFSPVEEFMTVLLLEFTFTRLTNLKVGLISTRSRCVGYSWVLLPSQTFWCRCWPGFLTGAH
jgi:hypothetical protein